MTIDGSLQAAENQIVTYAGRMTALNSLAAQIPQRAVSLKNRWAQLVSRMAGLQGSFSNALTQQGGRFQGVLARILESTDSSLQYRESLLQGMDGLEEDLISLDTLRADMADAIEEPLQAAAAAFADLNEQAAVFVEEEMMSLAEDTIEELTGTFEELKTYVMEEFLPGMMNRMKETVSALETSIQRLTEMFHSLMDDLKERAAELVEEFEKEVFGIIKQVVEGTQGILERVQELIEKIKTTFDAMSTTQSLATDVTQTTNAGMTMAIDTLNDVKWTIEKTLHL